jgi:hypothetical protein
MSNTNASDANDAARRGQHIWATMCGPITSCKQCGGSV